MFVRKGIALHLLQQPNLFSSWRYAKEAIAKGASDHRSREEQRTIVSIIRFCRLLDKVLTVGNRIRFC